MPFLVILVLTLHRLEVHVKVVPFGLLIAEMQCHAGVKAVLEFSLLLFLVVVKILVEVGDLRVIKLVGGHAILEDDPASSLEVQTLVIQVTGELVDN